MKKIMKNLKELGPTARYKFNLNEIYIRNSIGGVVLVLSGLYTSFRVKSIVKQTEFNADPANGINEFLLVSFMMQVDGDNTGDATHFIFYGTLFIYTVAFVVLARMVVLMKRLHNYEYMTHRKELLIYGVALLVMASLQIVSSFQRAYTTQAFYKCATNIVCRFSNAQNGGLSDHT